MFGRERRRANGESVEMTQLKAGLTPEQLATLATMEQFRWTLKYVRRPMFESPIPVVFDRGRQRYAVLEPDGSINENPGFKIRD
ncbi:MAG: hypothetical protein LH470_11950 [Lysobacter sp.]|nr:hypothetical protein [Lysobacter sp.]